MIEISEVAVQGTIQDGEFKGAFHFDSGFQVISANNNFGKSLAATSIAWCLGLEPMFGLKDDDTSRFPVAVKDVITLGEAKDLPVISSEASLTLKRSDGISIRLCRPIKGNSSQVKVEEFSDGKLQRTSVLNARRQGMKDETGGLQNFLFSWIGLPREQVVTRDGRETDVYLENIAPLFFIDQSEGWTDLQALQVFRYRQLDIQQVAVEFLLGAHDALRSRVIEQTFSTRESDLKRRAEYLSELVHKAFVRRGFEYSPSTHGSVTTIAKRWNDSSLFSHASSQCNFDYPTEQSRLKGRIEKLKEQLGSVSQDQRSNWAASEASQRVITLKGKRHVLREKLREARLQRSEQESLLGSLSQRIHTTRDVLRLKTEGIGRFDQVECPACHRSLEPASFNLSQQSVESVSAHIEALARDEKLIRSNHSSAEALATRLAAELAEVDSAIRTADQILAAVNASAGSDRELVTKAAIEIGGIEREIEKNEEFAIELRKLNEEIKTWVKEAGDLSSPDGSSGDLASRITAFEGILQSLLVALGHSAIPASSTSSVNLDSDYIPYLGPRRLRSLGSASDHSRLVTAYSLALAVAAQSNKGSHPGFVLLDEPLQQNPDEPHKKMFFKFLENKATRSLPIQTIVFTYLKSEEVKRLQKAGVNIKTPPGEHFLSLVEAAAE